MDHFGVALQHGLLTMIKSKVDALARELGHAEDALKRSAEARGGAGFLRSKVCRAKKVCDTAQKLLGSPILKLLDKLLEGKRA